MDGLAAAHEAPSLREYVQVAQRRKWIIALGAVLVPFAAIVISFMQQPTYGSSAEVLINRQNIAQTLTGTVDPTASDATRVLATQVALARLPDVAKRALVLAGPDGEGLIPPRFLRITSVTEKPDADVLVFTAKSNAQRTAERLATSYARAFVDYRHRLDTAALKQALHEVDLQLAKLREVGQLRSPLYSSLTVKAQQLQTIQTLQGANASVIKDAETAPQISPQPRRNAFIGLGLGIILGIVLAFIVEALDTRIRSTDAIVRQLNLPLLARIPSPPGRLSQNDRIAMLEERQGAHAESFRVLRTNLEFFNLDLQARTILVTSPMSNEGKSTTAANLAVAFARAGRHVLLVDLDLRRPTLDKFFDLRGMPGVVDVLEGDVSLDDAIVEQATDDSHDVRGSLHVLPAGRVSSEAGELLLTRGMNSLLDQLAKQADVVLIDSPPMLNVGDALGLSARVDAMLVVVRLNQIRRAELKELDRMLDAAIAPKLGFVVTGADEEPDYGYTGYATYYLDAPRSERV
ncbi:MAG: tyrosine-protein kinase [Gaiellaceae bacterium]|nr:tyrosine-protein kinase [Gaiellaceae bacterium]